MKPDAVYLSDRSAAKEPITKGWVRAIYRNAVEYTTFDKSVRGVVFLMGGIMPASGAAFFFVLSLKLMIKAAPMDSAWIIFAIGIPSSLAFLTVGLWCFINAGRREFFRPLDLPIIFDRQRRKVYRLDQTPPLSLLSAFMPWPIRYVEHDWDDIVAEHHVVTYTTGGSVHRQHTLALMVRDKNPGEFKGEITPDNTPPYVEGFALGDPKTLSELTTPRVWEHVRRYMNEDGPALPDGEALADTAVPLSWWQSLAAVSVFGPGYIKRWQQIPIMMSVLHVFLPLMLPLGILLACTNWLSYRTAYPVKWPSEVLQKIGPPERESALQSSPVSS